MKSRKSKRSKKSDQTSGVLYITLAIPCKTKQAAVPVANRAWDRFSTLSGGGWIDAQFTPDDIPHDETPYTANDL